MNKPLTFDVRGLSDVGLKREENEDVYLSYVPDVEQEFDRHGALFMVADGMGSYGNGRFAAQSAVDRIKANYYDAGQSIEEAVKQANRSIYQETQINSQYEGMGTTIVGAVVFPTGRLQVFNVGDSRAYLLRDGRLIQLTNDHSVVANRMREMGVSWEEAAKLGKANQLTRSVGRKSEVDVESYPEQQVGVGDVLLLCSDGLWRPAGDEEVQRIIHKARSAQVATTRLIQMANQCGGPDNITALIVRCLKPGAKVPVETVRTAPIAVASQKTAAKNASKTWLLVFPLLALLALAALFVMPSLNLALPAATSPAGTSVQLAAMTPTNTSITSQPTVTPQIGGDVFPYGSLAVLNNPEERIDLPAQVTLTWEPPIGLATLADKQVYRIMIAYVDQLGNTQNMVATTRTTEYKLAPDNFFVGGKPLSKDGRYSWQVELIEQSVDGQEKPLSPRTPAFAFYWLAKPPKPTYPPTPVPSVTTAASPTEQSEHQPPDKPTKPPKPTEPPAPTEPPPEPTKPKEGG